MELSSHAQTYIEHQREEALKLLLELARIPGPSNHEEKRAEFCKTWLIQNGAAGTYTDSALNVIYPVNCSGRNSIVVFMAHSDVVFPDTEELPLRTENGRIYCPGIGDNSANIIALLTVIKYINENKFKPKNTGLLFVINSGEEGLGNLKGCRKIIEEYGSRITEFYAIDGSNAKITNSAVGSKRYRVEVITEGGHSFRKFGNRNAIACLASLLTSLYEIKVPEQGKTTYNVGTISGGTSVNTIAQQADMLYEIRSDSRESLATMERHFNAAIDFYRTKGITVNVELAGDRPCMGDVDPARQQALMDKAAAAVRKYFRKEPIFESGSTDCNIPFSVGIPSVALGCYFGENSHTREEYLEIESLLPGLQLAFSLVLEYFSYS